MSPNTPAPSALPADSTKAPGNSDDNNGASVLKSEATPRTDPLYSSHLAHTIEQQTLFRSIACGFASQGLLHDEGAKESVYGFVLPLFASLHSSMADLKMRLEHWKLFAAFFVPVTVKTPPLEIPDHDLREYITKATTCATRTIHQFVNEVHELKAQLERIVPPPSPDKSAGGTPRTDVEVFYRDSQPVVEADFARTLERELAQAQQSLDNATERNESLMHQVTWMSNQRKTLTEWYQERNALRAQLKDLTDQFFARSQELASLQEWQAAVIKESKGYSPGALVIECESQRAQLAQLKQERDEARGTLEAYRKRARKLYTPDVASTKIAEDEARMRDVDKQLEIATATLRYFGLEVVNEIGEGVKMLMTDEKSGVKQCAYVRVIPGGSYAGDQSELKILREEFDKAQRLASPASSPGQEK